MDSDGAVTRVLIVDDHPVFRHGLRVLLDSEPGTSVIGEAEGGAEAVQLATRLRPDVVIMDLAMPGLDGAAATRRIREAVPQTQVLVLTMFADDDSVFTAMRAGARGYLVKGADGPEVLRAVAGVAAGEAIFGPAVAERVLSYLTRPLSARDERHFPQLTEREREVLELMARGLGNARIAADLHLSAKTVRNHASSIFTKLQVADRADAIVRARRAGLGLADGEPG